MVQQNYVMYRTANYWSQFGTCSRYTTTNQ